MLSPGSVISSDSIVLSLITNLLDPRIGQQSLSDSAAILKTIYTSDLRAYFITKPFYKAVGIMDFPQKVKDTYQKLEELINKPWAENVGFSALHEIEELAYKAEDCGKNIIMAKFIARLLSIEEKGVIEAISASDVLFKIHLSAEINKRKHPAVCIDNILSNSSRGSVATDTDEFDYHAPPSLSWM